MTKRPTMQVVAEVAGVSIATVDRVLNSRLPVKDSTSMRVIEAAQSVGYHATELMKMRVRQQAPLLRLGICLQKDDSPFYQSLRAAFQTAADQALDVHGVRCLVKIEFIGELAARNIADHLLAVGSEADALAVVSLDHPHISDAVERLRRRGKPTYVLLSDISAPGRSGYIGLDNSKVGRTAAWMLERSTRDKAKLLGIDNPKIGVLVGSHRYLGHEIREMSLRSYFREHAKEYQILDSIVNLEDPQLAYEATLDLLHRHTDLVGIFLAGGGAEGMLRALREHDTAGRISVVGSELSLVSRSALIEGYVDMVISTPAKELAETTVAAMIAALGGGDKSHSAALPLAAQHIIDLRIDIAETI